MTSAPNVSQSVDVTDTTITLNWTEPAVPNGVVTGYVITVTNGVTGEVFTVNTTDTEFEVTGLTPYTNYTFTVAAVNGAGVGNASNPVTVLTAEGGVYLSLHTYMYMNVSGIFTHTAYDPQCASITVTSAPNVSQSVDITDTTVILNWTEPAVPNGVVTGYVITVTNGVTGEVFTVNTTDTEFEVTGLTPYTNYTFSVAAVNGAGVGNTSNSVTVQTAEGGVYLSLHTYMYINASGIFTHTTYDPPCASITVTSAPNVSQSVDITDTTVILNWTEPAVPNGVVTGYVITVTNGVTGEVFTVNTTDTEFEVTGLTPYTNYTFTVAAVNGAGVGNASNPVTVQTAEGGVYSTCHYILIIACT